MYAAHEISQVVRTRRTDMGITQGALAKLSGLSRATVNQVENGTIKDLSITRAASLLDALGLSMSLSPARGGRDPGEPLKRMTFLERVAQSASVSYRRGMPVEALLQAVATGQVPIGFAPHLNAALEDSTAALLSGVAEEVHASTGLERSKAWSNMRAMAKSLGSRRELWQC